MDLSFPKAEVINTRDGFLCVGTRPGTRIGWLRSGGGMSSIQRCRSNVDLGFRRPTCCLLRPCDPGFPVGLPGPCCKSNEIYE